MFGWMQIVTLYTVNSHFNKPLSYPTSVKRDFNRAYKRGEGRGPNITKLKKKTRFQTKPHISAEQNTFFFIFPFCLAFKTSYKM